MSKWKDFFEKIIFKDETEDEPAEEAAGLPAGEPEQIAPQPPEEEEATEGPIPVPRDFSKVVRDITLNEKKPAAEAAPEPKPSGPEAGTFITLTPEKPASPAGEPKAPEPEVPRPPVKEEEKPQEPAPYQRSEIISPMFGVSQPAGESRRGRKKKSEPVKLPDLAATDSDGKSVLGTVFSPLYGDKPGEPDIPLDAVDQDVAKMTVSDLIAPQPASAEAAAEAPAEAEDDQPARRNGERQLEQNAIDLSVTPFGDTDRPQQQPEVDADNVRTVQVDLHEVWKADAPAQTPVIENRRQKLTADDDGQMRLFDEEDR